MRLARANLKAQHFDTFFGQVWTLLNPLLLAGVYFLIIAVVLDAQSNTIEYLGILLSGLFVFYYTRHAVILGSGAVLGGSKLIMNTAFPRLLLPLSAMVSAVFRFAPMLVVYALFHVAAGFPVGFELVFIPVILAILTVFNFGLILAAAAATVFVRDLKNLLPFVLRIWLYTSPVLYTVDQVPEEIEAFFAFNPMYPIIGSWHSVLIDGDVPSARLMAYATLWAVVVLSGGAWYFLRRERDFAVRI